MIPCHGWLQPIIRMANYIINYFSEWSNHCYISWLFPSNCNSVVSLSPLFIVIFKIFYVISFHRWVRPLVWITDYLRTTVMSGRIIPIYHHCFYPRTMAWFHRHRCWFLYFELLYDSSYLLNATTNSDGWFHWKYFSGWSNHWYMPWFFFSDHNGVFSPSTLLIIIFWDLYVIPPHRWVLPLVWISV